MELASLPSGLTGSWHHFDILAQQMAHQLTQVETSNRTVSGGHRRLILFHPATAKLAAMFGVADPTIEAGRITAKYTSYRFFSTFFAL